jgi:23S rRNA pseudouridine1911/1915/1917 synthase
VSQYGRINSFEGGRGGRVEKMMDHLPGENEDDKLFSFSVLDQDHGKRLDQFLAGTELSLSRSQAKKWIDEKKILLNGIPAKPSVHLKAGDRVSGRLPRPIDLPLEPEPIPLTVLYEDPSIIVVDKPAGMVVHPAPGNFSGTLVNALIHHCKDLAGINGVRRPGIVHRLDKETSGAIVVAKDDEAYHQLVRQFKNRTVEKVYLALARGRFSRDEGSIELAIGRHPSERKRMSTRTKRGRPAVTRWKVVERFDGLTLLEIYPKTGRTHQIRVHLSAMGRPILGDPLYGKKGGAGDVFVKECSRKMNRQALHAHRLGFLHPRTGERVEFVSPIPQDMREVLEWLRSRSGVAATKLETRNSCLRRSGFAQAGETRNKLNGQEFE